ncbi:hypothetical protein MC378_10290 [Polaribacter sp. MSW13]|uniref:Uncharacterized protein n=1 Tax=Polaribacter marinus TaxID=2916838 RepID=A0A9X2AJI8_9FLAO|nr:hypothetical protein [Polaribacter marinus]MCI2229556.1 hypothetical protein [Polaribacter marinus]
MKLQFKNKNNTPECSFNGSPIEAIETILMCMHQEELVRQIIITAAISFQQLGDVLEDAIEGSTITHKKKLVKNQKS